MNETQNYKNHTRWLPPFHFFLAPIVLINLIYSAVRLFMDPSWDRGMFLLLSIGFVAMMLLARTQALTAQDRLIRLEERLRLKNVLPAELAERAMNMTSDQYIALRFASDAEVAGLVERTLNGEFEKQKDIKLAIKDWRADNFRV